MKPRSRSRMSAMTKSGFSLISAAVLLLLLPPCLAQAAPKATDSLNAAGVLEQATSVDTLMREHELSEIHGLQNDISDLRSDLSRATGDVNRVTEESKHGGEYADRVITFVSLVSFGWLAVVTILFAAMLALGWKEIGIIKTIKEDSKAAAEDARRYAAEIKTLEDQVNVSAKHVKAIDDAIAKSVDDVKKSFAKLSLVEIEHLGISGTKNELPPTEEITLFEEADLIIVYAEKVGLIDGVDAAQSLLKLGLYWRTVGNFPRAIARFSKAAELQPNFANAHVALGRAFYTLAAHSDVEPVTPEEKERLLRRAIEEADRADKINGAPLAATLFDRGWIADEREEFEAAVDFYRRGRQTDPTGDGADVSYNIACALSKMGKQKEALDELRPIIGRDKNWEYVLHDRDLKGLRDHLEYGPQLRLLAEDARVANDK